MNNIHDIDKDEFFALLTDQAAAPDPVFVESLRRRVSSAGGSGGSNASLFGGLKHFVLIAVVSAAVLTGFTSMQSARPVANTVNQIDDSIVVAGNNPEQVSRQVGVELDSTVQPNADVSDDDQQLALESTTTNESNDSLQPAAGQPDTVATNADDIKDNSISALPDDIPFTVSFWGLDPFTSPPVMQDREPDETIAGIDSLDFSWGEDAPGSSGIVGSDYFIASAVGAKYLDAGDYLLDMSIDDGVRVYINEVLVYDRWSTDASFASDQVQFSVDDDPETVIRIEYYESTGAATLVAIIQEL